MKIFSENDIMDLNIRKNIIMEIEGAENMARKADAFKRYQIFKDRTKDYVYDKLKKEMGVATALEMIHRTPNISIMREIVEKKANVYKEGVSRVTKKNDQKNLDTLAGELKINSVMKKTNKYVELFKNCAVQIRPYRCQKTDLYEIELNVLAPYLYDVIEDANSPERPLVYILSRYVAKKDIKYAEPNEAGKRSFSDQLPMRGDGKDQIIADSPQDKGANEKQFIWWSDQYHFTTNEKGEIIAGDNLGDNTNPIGEAPFVSFSVDQDGNYWAIGGEDTVDTSILINLLLADLFYIAKFQGMGIFYMTGRGLPAEQKIGPSSAIIIDQKEGDPNPTVGFATSNPPISAHLEMINKLLAFLLSTNSLSAGSANLDSAASATSGVQEMIKKSETTEDIEDQRELYRDREPEIFERAIKWLNLYGERNLLEEDWAILGTMNPDMDITVKFNDAQPFMSEEAKLNVIEKRMALGLDTLLDAIKKDNPGLTEKEAKKKLEELLITKADESREKMKMFMDGGTNGGQQDNEENQDQGSDGLSSNA